LARRRRGYQYIDPEAVAKLGRFNLVARAVVEGFVVGLHRSPYHGFSVEFSDHREYVPGDNLRDLDWIAYGRTDRFFIKRYEEETNLRAHILLDSSASMGYRFGDEGLTKFEYAAYLSASLAYLMVRQQDSVGLVTFDQEVSHFIPPSSTVSHLNRLLRTLEEVSPGKTTDVSETFHKLAESIKRRGLIIIVSDLFDDQAEVMRALSHFRQKKHEVIVFHVLDRAEREFPFDRLSDFVDMETRERIQADPRYVREQYIHEVNAFIDSYRRECFQNDIDYVDTDTAVPYELMLAAYLGRREKTR